MKVRFYADLWPGLDPARSHLYASTSPPAKHPDTVRVAFDVAIPDALLFCVDAVSPEVGKVEIVEDHVDG